MKKPTRFFLLSDVLSFGLTGTREGLDDLKALAHISAGIPVLSAAKLDVSGYYKGYFVKVGGDYVGASH